MYFPSRFFLQLSAYGAELSSEACRELGFSSNLLCTSCDLLGEFSLTKLQPNCQQCCQQEALMEPRKVKLSLADWGGWFLSKILQSQRKRAEFWNKPGVIEPAWQDLTSSESEEATIFAQHLLVQLPWLLGGLAWPLESFLLGACRKCDSCGSLINFVLTGWTESVGTVAAVRRSRVAHRFCWLSASFVRGSLTSASHSSCACQVFRAAGRCRCTW